MKKYLSYIRHKNFINSYIRLRIYASAEAFEQFGLNINHSQGNRYATKHR